MTPTREQVQRIVAELIAADVIEANGRNPWCGPMTIISMETRHTLRAMLEAMMPLMDIGMCHNGMPHYCPNCDRSFGWAAHPPNANQPDATPACRHTWSPVPLISSSDYRCDLCGMLRSQQEAAGPADPPVLRYACFTMEDGVYESATGEHVAYSDYEKARAEIALEIEAKNSMREALHECQKSAEKVSVALHGEIAALKAAQVPRNPTAAMLVAGIKCAQGNMIDGGLPGIADCWRAMWDAATNKGDSK